MRKLLRKKDNIRARKKAIKTKQEDDWEAKKLGLACFKKAVRRAKRDSWHSFVESVNSQTPTARLVKIIRRNETVRVSRASERKFSRGFDG